MSEILIVDDDVASCRTLQLRFQSQGHRARLAHSVEEGLAAVAKALMRLKSNQQGMSLA